MSKKIGFLQRWMFIINKISSQPYITMDELTRAIETEMFAYDGIRDIGTKIRTIERDIAEIRNSPYMDISIEFSRRHGGYYIPQDEKSMSKLARMFELSSLLSFNELKDIVMVEKRKPRGLEHRFSLINAIRHSLEVVVEYRKYKPDEASPKTWRLQPYALREFKNRWYLLALKAGRDARGSDDLITYGLDRIERLTVTKEAFARNNEIDVVKKFEHCFGIFANQSQPTERVVLSFTPVGGMYNESFPLHESQQVLVSNEKEFRISLDVKITPDFVMELLSQSEGLRVIEPRHLKDRLIDIHRRAIGLLEEESE